MLTSTWFAATLQLAGILVSVGLAAAKPGPRHGTNPFHHMPDNCPERCSVSGPNPGNWTVYPDMRQLRLCQETVFYGFSVYDPVDDDSSSHRIHACTSFGPDFSQLQNSTTMAVASSPISASYEIGWWGEGFGLAAARIRSLTKQARRYLAYGHGATDKPTIMFAQAGQATIGLYVGQSLHSQVIGSSALKLFEDNLANLNTSTPSVAMQLCGPDLGSAHSFGLMVTSNATFGSLQHAVQSWANGTCLSFSQSTNMTGEVLHKTPVDLLEGVKNSTISSKAVTTGSGHGRRHQHLHVRAECRTTRVEGGDSCAKLATRCGISASDFTKYNPGSKFCAELVPKQHVCCSKGELPDLRPSKNSDGSCHAYTVEEGDNCASIAVENGLKLDDLEKFNKKTWGWSGCKRLFYKAVMCLSDGDPPFPEPIANAQCGPQKPGSKAPSGGKDLADLNPCPLNACCNIWGQCGITKEFCTDTNTGAPGTAKEGTYGCISNCGTEIVRSGGDGSVRIGYFQGYGLSRECLLQDASQIDTSKYTHVHFAFGTMTKNYDVEVGDKLSQYQFNAFKRLKGVKRILSFGGWDFSANPATYSIFREGVKPANRLAMATKIANFIIKHDLEGVDIDWEYPGAPDFPDIPPADKDEGTNYNAFLAVLKNLLRGKSLSIAAPSSWWYLKQYPIKDIAKLLDYIVYMTYDLHGQWDTENPHSQEGCDFGNCLRSQVNLTETQYSLAMITKAGVPSNKVIVGVTSFGRSFKMAEAGCYGPNCFYTGNKLESGAKKGKCTGTAGYIADAEINEILKDSSRVTKHFVDQTSHSDILVYDETEWVAYMGSATKKTRENMYKSWQMGGTTDWAVDLQTYHDAPKPAKNWAIFKEDIYLDKDPTIDESRVGNWTDYYCDHDLVRHKRLYNVTEQWNGLQAKQAWADAIRIWKTYDKQKNDYTFSTSVGTTFTTTYKADCGKFEGHFCDKMPQCDQGLDSDLSGPAAQLIWASFMKLHEMFAELNRGLVDAAAVISFSLDDFGNKFAPIPEEEDLTWAFAIIDLVTWGTATIAGPFFNSFLSKLPYFKANKDTLDNVKDTTMTMIGQSTTLAKDLMSAKTGEWTPEKQSSFNSYMGQVIKDWQLVNSMTLSWLFSGENEPINMLWNLMSDGKMLGDDTSGTNNYNESVRANIEKAFYGYNIPVLWNVSGTHAFILDSGYNCYEEYPVEDYLTKGTMDATNACYGGSRYYLVYPKGDSETCTCRPSQIECNRMDCEDGKFSIPPGLDSLDGKRFGGITVSDLIAGAVRTYENNGRKNAETELDPTTDKKALSNLIDMDMTLPGIVNIPVCSPERAFQSWDTTKKGSSKYYPCDIPPGKQECGESSFENETSDASPLAKDCQVIIKNIEGDGTTRWTHQVLGLRHREILTYGTCAFGIEATEAKGNADFMFGGQDVIDIINTAIEKYSKNGKVGAKGNVDCNGNIKKQPVKWGIYYN